MGGRLIRIWAMALKELKVVLLDKRARTTLIISPVLQLLLFGYASTLEVKNIDVGVVNRDSGVASERFLAGLSGSRNVRALEFYPDAASLNDAIAHREVIAGVLLPPDLSRDVAAGRTGEIGLVLDGRRINAAQIVNGYLGEIASQAGAELRAAPIAPQVVTRHWFNPNLEYRWFTMPAMIAVITAVLMVSVSAQAVARERELGTYDQLMILPLRPHEVLAGKLVPAFLVGLFNGLLYVAMIPWLYGVPMLGSVGPFFIAIVAFALSITGIGLSISALAQSQQQAFLSSFLVTVPLILLSGYASPSDNMPVWLQPFAEINPLTHMLLICEGIFVKGWDLALVMSHVWPILLVAISTITLAGWLFRLRSE
jgi:ABC-2 type transport system permease protein